MTSKHAWHGVLCQRLSRWRLLAAGLAVGAASAAAACGGGEEARPPTPTSPPSGGVVPVKTRGGVYRAFGYDAMPLHTYDPNQTQFGLLYNMHSAVFSKAETNRLH
jgi:hypothetical protein